MPDADSDRFVDHRADALRRRMSRFTRTHGEVRRLGLARRASSPVWMFIDADAERPDLAGQPAAAVDRNDAAAVQADAAAVEQVRRVGGRRPPCRAGAAAREVEDAAPLEEEVALLRERTG